MAQLAIAWCLKNPNVSTVIMSASRANQVRKNIMALVVPQLIADVTKRSAEIVGDPEFLQTP